MFDVEKDPNELNNVYDNPEYASIVNSLNRELNQLRKQYQVPDEDPDFQKLRQEARERRRRGEI